MLSQIDWWNRVSRSKPLATIPTSSSISHISAMAGNASVMRRLYLSFYNWIVFIGWVQVSWSMILALLENGYEAVYAAVEQHLLFAQTAAIMEILHSIVGLVRSPVSSTIPQITGRLFMIWGILWSFPETHTHIFVTSLLISWCITEVTRYCFYGMKESFGFTPSWLLWLRYSTFIVCLPVGTVSEVGLVYIVLPFMKASGKYCLRMPNKWNFSSNYFYASIFFMVLYAPVYPRLFRYLIAQRKKALAKAKTTYNYTQELSTLISARGYSSGCYRFLSK
uniref:Very-long-chain (3R)-3-hydroxyacyl-CoA dehydratase n=2 Tax=Oryza meridionalis TaxID=40149 RepID=A0A0E0EL94_9ORYZ